MRRFAKVERAVDLIIIREMQLLGEKCVNLCRELDTYKDDTGNLRSSIGYVIYVNFEKHTENYKAFAGNSDGSEGVQAAKDFADKIANEGIKTHYCMYILAGMNYAGAVEFHGYPVLTPAEGFAENEFSNIKARIIRSIKRAK